MVINFSIPDQVLKKGEKGKKEIKKMKEFFILPGVTL